MRRRGDITWHNPPVRTVPGGCLYCDLAIGRYTLGQLNAMVTISRGWRQRAKDPS